MINRTGFKIVLLMAVSAMLIVACGGGGGGGGGGGATECRYSNAVKVNTLSDTISGLQIASADRQSQSARVSWTAPLFKTMLIEVQVGNEAPDYKEINSVTSVLLTSNDGLDINGIQNEISVYVFDKVSCTTSQPERTSIVLLDYKRTEPTLTLRPVTVRADNNNDSITDAGQEDFTVGVQLAYADTSATGTNQNYTITIRKTGLESGAVIPTTGGTTDAGIEIKSTDSITLKRVGSASSVVLYDQESVAVADAYNTDGDATGKAVGNSFDRTYDFTNAGGGSYLFVHTDVTALRPGTIDGTDKFSISPVRFRFGVAAAQVFVSAVMNAPLAGGAGAVVESNFIYSALTPSYTSDLKDSIQLFQQSSDNAVAYSVLQLKKSASGTVYVYSNEPNQLGTNVAGCSNFIDDTTKLVDFSKITNEADETKFAACEFSKKLDIQGNEVVLKTSTLQQFISESLNRSLSLSFVLSYDLGASQAAVKGGGNLNTSEVMAAIAATEVDGTAIGYGNRVLSSVVYAPYDSTKASDPVVPSKENANKEYTDLTAEGAKAAFTTFLVRANVSDTLTATAADIGTGNRPDGTTPLVGGVILTVDTAQPVYYPVTADTGSILAGVGSDTGTVTDNRVAPFASNANISAFITDLGSKNLFIIRDMVRPDGVASYSDIIFGVGSVASGNVGMEPSIELEYNAGVRSYMLNDATPNAPIRSAVQLLGLDPTVSTGTEPTGTIAQGSIHSYGFSSASLALSDDGLDVVSQYTYPAYGALVADSSVKYALTLTPQLQKDDGSNYPLISRDIDGKESVPNTLLGRYQVFTLTNRVPNPAYVDGGSESKFLFTEILNRGLPVVAAGSGEFGVSAEIDGTGCTTYILSDSINLPYTFASQDEAEKFATTITYGSAAVEDDPATTDDDETVAAVADKVTGGICLVIPRTYSESINVAVSDLGLVANVPYAGSTILNIGGKLALPSKSDSITSVLVGPSSLRASQNIDVPNNKIHGIDIKWSISPETYMFNYTISVSDSTGVVVATALYPKNATGVSFETFTILNSENNNSIRDNQTYRITLSSKGQDGVDGDGNPVIVDFAPITALVTIDVGSASISDILNRLYDTSAATNKKVVAVAGSGFMGRPETSGNAPIGTLSAIERARELGFGGIEFTLYPSHETDVENMKLYLLATDKFGVENTVGTALSASQAKLGRSYSTDKAYYSCANNNYEGKKYTYNADGTLASTADGTKWADDSTDATQLNRGLVSDTTLSAAELDTCYVRVNQGGGVEYGSNGFTNFPGYGGKDGEKIPVLNGKFVDDLKAQNMVLYLNISALESFPRLTPEKSIGEVNIGDENYNRVLKAYTLLLEPFLQADYARGLVVYGSGETNLNVVGAARVAPQRANVLLYLDLRYAAYTLGNIAGNGVDFNTSSGSGDTIDDNIPTILVHTGHDPISDQSVEGTLKTQAGKFTLLTVKGQPIFKPVSGLSVPGEIDGENKIVSVVAYNHFFDSHTPNYGIAPDNNIGPGEHRVITPGLELNVGSVDSQFSTKTFDYNPNKLSDITTLSKLTAVAAPSIRLITSESAKGGGGSNPFARKDGNVYKIINTTAAMADPTTQISYGIDTGFSGELFYDYYTDFPKYDYDKGGYTETPGRFDDALGLAAAGYLGSYSSTFVIGDNILPLSIAFGELNRLANQGGNVVQAAITNAPEVENIDIKVGSSGRELSMSIKGGASNRLEINSLAGTDGKDTIMLKNLYNTLYQVAEDNFVGYEINIVGQEDSPVFKAATSADYGSSIAFSEAGYPTSPFEIRVRAKYEIPYVDGGGKKTVYSFGQIYSVQ